MGNTLMWWWKVSLLAPLTSSQGFGRLHTDSVILGVQLQFEYLAFLLSSRMNRYRSRRLKKQKLILFSFSSCGLFSGKTWHTARMFLELALEAAPFQCPVDR